MQKLEKEVQASKETIETIVDKNAADKERVSNAKSKRHGGIAGIAVV